jgi:hypothetical protein
MHWLGLAIMTLAAASPALVHADDERAIGVVEARVIGGLAAGGGAGVSAWRRAPTHLGILVEHATMVEPWTSIYGEIFFEGFDRGGAGAGLGLRVRPRAGSYRASVGVESVVTPYTLAGVVAGAGACPLGLPLGRACLDVEGRLYLLGDDLPEGRVAAMLTVSLGASFDAW